MKIMSLEEIRCQIMGEREELENSVFREHEVLAILIKYLKEEGWKIKQQIKIDGGRIDIGAVKEGEILLIEAKGEDKGGYTSAEMNFQMGLGQLMSRMKEKGAKYGLAFPLTGDFMKVLQKYRGSFAFEKLGIYLIPVERDGNCRMISPHEVIEFLKDLTDVIGANREEGSVNVIKFENDDEGYKDWLRRNPNGYVINCPYSLNPNNMFLHKATCHTISGSPARGDTWTCGQYFKICSNENAELERWARERINRRVQYCRHCEP
ncbi:hypothetical protein ES705_23306 [subsurface metagenome]